MLAGGVSLGGVMTAGFGCVQFIPYTHSLAYTLKRFTLRAGEAVGCAAIFTSVYTHLTDLFPKHSTLVLVCVASRQLYC